VVIPNGAIPESQHSDVAGVSASAENTPSTVEPLDRIAEARKKAEKLLEAIL
jgi:hypothetical protein